MSETPETDDAPKGGWRQTVGTWMFTVPFLMFFGAPVVIPLLGLTAGQTTAAIGGIIVAAEVIWGSYCLL